MTSFSILKRLLMQFLVVLPLGAPAFAQQEKPLTCTDLPNCMALVLVEDACDPTCSGYVPGPYHGLEERFKDFGREGVDALLPLLDHKHEMVRNKAALMLSASPHLSPKDAPAILNGYRRGNGWLTGAVGPVVSDAELPAFVAEGLANPGEEFGQLLEAVGNRAEKPVLESLDCANRGKCEMAVIALDKSLSYSSLISAVLAERTFAIAEKQTGSPKARRSAVALALKFLLGQDVYRRKPDDWAMRRLKTLQQDDDSSVADAALDFLVRYEDPEAIAALALAEAKAAKYFPMTVYNSRPREHSFIEKWYGKHLSVLKEPSLFPAKDGAEIYRFTWLRTFDNPIVFRIDVDPDGAGTFVVRRANGAGGYAPGVMDLEKTIVLDKANIAAIQSKWKSSGFWTLESTVESGGMDGAQWIFEANHNGQYKLVDRWSGGEMQDLGLTMMKLSGVEVGEIY